MIFEIQVETILDYTWDEAEEMAKWTEEDFQDKFDADGDGCVGRREAANGLFFPLGFLVFRSRLTPATGFAKLGHKLDDEERHCVFALFAGWPLDVEFSYFVFVESWLVDWLFFKLKVTQRSFQGPFHLIWKCLSLFQPENYSWLRDDRAKPDATEVSKSIDLEGPGLVLLLVCIQLFLVQACS